MISNNIMSADNFSHDHWMELALEEARKASAENEVPVGAVIVRSNNIIFADHNRTRQNSNPLDHAEKLIIDKILSHKIKFLYDCSLYVTLEPCLMCAGMMIWARLGTLVFGAADPKTGAVGSVYNILADKCLNHHPQIVRGILETECATLLTDFFRERRR